MLVITAPGQGAQSPGFLLEWLELPGFSERLGSWSELAGADLVRCGTTAGADEITGTAVAQPLLVAAALAAAAELVSLAGPPDDLAGAAVAAGADAAAGHSVGELAAGAVAGAITPEDAMRLVRVRGRAMASAAAATATGLTAVLGGDEATVMAKIEAYGLTAANVNGAGQIVAGGSTDQLAAFAADPPPGARLRPLQVAGAFHTPYMAPAVDALRAAAADVTPGNPVLALLSNHDGRVVRSGTDWLTRIVAQVDTPVRWDKCMRAMAALGVTAMIELPPAGTLTGLARRALPGIQALALKSPADLVHAQELLAAGPADGAHDASAPQWRQLIAPLAGTFRACQPNGHNGAALGTGAELGHVEMRGDSQPISAAYPATIVEWLVNDGDAVTAGQPLVRLQRRASADTPEGKRP
jgi:[acyl-carrier-protein] S-malonyltransferase